jgi:L-2,4-diaminobutyrate decarboxylase
MTQGDDRERSPRRDSFGLADFHSAADDTLGQLCDYVRQSAAGQGPVINCPPMADIYERLELRRWLAQGGMKGEAFSDFLREYLLLSTRLHHPSYLAHQVATPDGPAALADLIHGVINNPMAVYEMGPAASTIEHAVLNWMIEKVGWVTEPVPGARTGHSHAGGTLTHGGSLANYTGLLAARNAAAPEAWRSGVPGDLVLLAPETCHYSVARAASMLGLGADAVWPLAVDGRGVLVAEQLPAMFDRVKAEKKRCMAVVANACATATGLYDPIAQVAHHCRQRGVWLHVDGAHGASALLSPRERTRLRGIEQADSMVWDAHKMLRTSALCAAILVRDARHLHGAFQQEASYLFYDEDNPGIDFIERTVECTKAGLGLKLFLNVAWRGEAELGAYVEGRYAAARRFHHIINARPGFHSPFEPESNIVVFRYGESDELQNAVRHRLVRQGSFYLSSAVVSGRRHLRMAVMSPDTSDATIEALLDAIVETASEADEGAPRKKPKTSRYLLDSRLKNTQLSSS